jgi:hypothetical protein
MIALFPLKLGQKKCLPDYWHNSRLLSDPAALSLSLQPSFYLLPSIEVIAEVTRLIGETIECDQLLVRICQTPSLPATLWPRNPEVRIDALYYAAMNRSDSAQKFGRGNDDEAGLVLNERWQNEEREGKK